MGGMCIAPSGPSRRGKSRPERCENRLGTHELADFPLLRRDRWYIRIGARNGLMMTRAGVTYVAIAAAAISASALGYAVIWSYGGSETPPVTAVAPPVQEMAPVAAQEL